MYTGAVAYPSVRASRRGVGGFRGTGGVATFTNSGGAVPSKEPRRFVYSDGFSRSFLLELRLLHASVCVCVCFRRAAWGDRIFDPHARKTAIKNTDAGVRRRPGGVFVRGDEGLVGILERAYCQPGDGRDPIGDILGGRELAEKKFRGRIIIRTRFVGRMARGLGPPRETHRSRDRTLKSRSRRRNTTHHTNRTL